MTLPIPATALELAASIARRHHPGHPITHPHAGADSERASVGLPGHCDTCAIIGHVTAHPDYGCGDVQCNSDHGDTADIPPREDPAADDYDDEADWNGVEVEAGHVLFQTGGDDATRVAVWNAKTGAEAVVELTNEQLSDLRDVLNSLFD